MNTYKRTNNKILHENLYLSFCENLNNDFLKLLFNNNHITESTYKDLSTTLFPKIKIELMREIIRLTTINKNKKKL